ncbi:AIPR family protein [Streptomyces sp. 8ZJF_21]|uniref:AIPR family protein n=1 Tax=Streptomyces sp. 8ZJF_21 TaxID=2903141 RepID=UPI001E295B0D|nr:AIPR family protein [Streptomyces sp. 8ZJF_21]MCD9587784.1 AIPR family protein [Streptomyces sp. 8ZJF_21]
MEHGTEALRGVPLEARQIRAALVREFVGLLDMDDVTTGSPAQRERVFLPRALAAKAVQLVADCTAAEAAAAVIDGVEDQGVDAVFVSPSTAEIWLIQAKWSEQGTARLNSVAVQQLLHGVQQILDFRYDRFNAKFQRLVPGIDALLGEAALRVHLVLAALADEGLSLEANDLLHEGVREFNRFGELVDIQILGVPDFHAIVLRESLPEPATINATLSDGWHMNSTPYQTYLGTVSAEELAGWYEQHGTRLFDQNVRFALGATDVNATMVDSLLNAPQEFWYLNNGITVLCDSVRTTFIARPYQGQPVRLELGNARVVNGAQTVAAVRQAYEQEPRAVAEALVAVRLICLDGAPNDLAQRITRATNTQNHVEARDFAALDPQQELIRQDLALSLGKSYVLKRGGPEPAPAAGCTMAEAALALTCAYPDAALLARYQADGDVLWRRASGGFYSRLFDNRPGALQIWRSVSVLRQVRDELAVLADSLEGRERVVADRAELLVAHAVFQLIGGDGIDEPGDDWEARGHGAVKRTGEILVALTDHLNARYGQHAFLTPILRDEQSCRHLVSDVLQTVQHGAGRRLVVPPRRNHRRRPNTVPFLVQHRLIDDGAQLIYRPGIVERDAVSAWLSGGPERYLATWVNDARKPLIWALDGRRYSPSGLVLQIWERAGWVEQPAAVQGTTRWYLPGEGSLADLAGELLADMEAAGDGPGVE